MTPTRILPRFDFRVEIAAETVIGKVRFRNGENVSTPGVVSQWQSGEFEVVWPPDRATAPAMHPKPSWR